MLQWDSVTHAPLQYLCRFAVVILTPLKASMVLDGDSYWSRCKDVNGL
jgi:hypothetical protein